MSVFETKNRVRFGHVDPAAIVFYPRIYDYLHEAFEDLWEHHFGVPYAQLIVEQRIGFPLVHSQADFRRPLRFGDEPLIRITCLRLGGRAFTLRYRFLLDGELCIDARMVTVCVQMDTLKPLPIPPQFRPGLEALLEHP